MDQFLNQEFGNGQYQLKELDGYDNKNYLVSTSKGRYIVKTYDYSIPLSDQINEENSILLYLNSKVSGVYPLPIKLTNGQYTHTITQDGTVKIIRLLTYLKGEFMGNTVPSTELYQSLGTLIAEMDLILQGMDSYVLKSRQWQWDLQYFKLNKVYLDAIDSHKDRNLVRYFFQQYELYVEPVLPSLRKQVIHNDANEWNILTNDNRVTGLIDFGDLAHSYLINELAITITYGIYDKENPIDWAVIIIEAYHKVLPLEEQEIDILYYLIAARLCTSVCNSAHSAKVDPDNHYASVSQQRAWRMLHHWLTINPTDAKNRFRLAAQMEVVDMNNKNKILAERYQYISKTYSLSYKEPIQMTRSAYQYMYDSSGNTYLDAYNNIPHVGHSHPKVVTAGQQQMAVLNTNTRYLYNHLTDYAKQLLSKFPKTLSKVFLVNSGSAASDLAIRMANIHTGYTTTMVMELGYHGNTHSGIEISDYKFNNPKGPGQKPHIIKTAIPNTYNGKYTSSHDDPGLLYGRDAVAQIEHSHSPISTFISEPIVGCAGQVPLADNYLRQVYPAIRAQGGVCISDEVQTGFGRTGDHFWGYEAQGVIPDMVILGKPIANGHPMGAVVCTDEIAESFEQGVEFFSSFGGNPVSCAIAGAVLDVIEDEALQENAKLVGDYYKSKLKDLMHKHPSIGDVRGSGLFIGVELVMPDSNTPNTALAAKVKNEMRNRYILVSTDGPYDNIIKSKPPLCFTKSNADLVVNTIDQILSEIHHSSLS